ncbi:HYD3 [Auxenochlorella protothecoides x Auxenochlorella symbiontica]
MFSGAVKISDISDFIHPSQDCVVSIGGTKEAILTSELDESGMVQVQRPRTAGALQKDAGAQAAAPVATLGAHPPPSPVTISLNDCLACSGCITSAETVLLQAQSTAQLLGKLEEARAGGHLRVAISLSPQSVVSLAVAAGQAPALTQSRLAAALRALGAHAVFSTAPARDLALADAAAEAVGRLRAAARSPRAGEESAAPRLPVLASTCPGWVCYAEKTHGAWVLPFLSRTKSAQAVTASLIKGSWAAGEGVAPEDVFHCSIMPCFDKKLEASREDFTLGIEGSSRRVAETDCVLATAEVAALLQERGLRLDSPLPGEEVGLDTVPRPASPGRGLVGRAGWMGAVHAGSGSYMEAVLRGVASELHGVELEEGTLVTQAGRNPDIQETSLDVASKTVFRAAAIYGFRNIQGLMRRLRLGKCPYDYVEVMACPSGCLNGGGQLRPSPGQTPAQLIQAMEEGYHAWRGDLTPGALGDSDMLAGPWLDPGSAARLLHTQYHHREKSAASVLKDW